MNPAIVDVTEQKRLNDAREAGIPWKKWGPYLSERQWGTVREDYSEDGNAWDYFTHDQSRSRAYRWGEDGLGGICDDKQRLCFALALWNERDPILKERLFGLTNSEGNHGEDVKEYYFYVDSTPTHSYMKYLYKYPQREFPYRDLVETNRRRSREEFEYELLDTGVFDDDRYFDVFVEYAKAGPEDVLVRITVHNRGPEAARLRVLPTLWFRNTWSWGEDERKPSLRAGGAGRHRGVAPRPGRVLAVTATARRSCSSPRTRATRSGSGASPIASPYVKDAFHAYVVSGRREAVNPGAGRDQGGGPLHARRARAAAARRVAPAARGWRRRANAFADFERRFESRIGDADEFYQRITPQSLERGRAPRAPPGAGRHAVEQAVLLLRPGAVAERAPEPSAARDRRGTACGTPSGSTCSTPTSSRCRTSGNTRGTRPGTSPSTPSRSRWWTSISPRISCC